MELERAPRLEERSAEVLAVIGAIFARLEAREDEREVQMTRLSLDLEERLMELPVARDRIIFKDPLKHIDLPGNADLTPRPIDEVRTDADTPAREPLNGRPRGRRRRGCGRPRRS